MVGIFDGAQLSSYLTVAVDNGAARLAGSLFGAGAAMMAPTTATLRPPQNEPASLTVMAAELLRMGGVQVAPPPTPPQPSFTPVSDLLWAQLVHLQKELLERQQQQQQLNAALTAALMPPPSKGGAVNEEALLMAAFLLSSPSSLSSIKAPAAAAVPLPVGFDGGGGVGPEDKWSVKELFLTSARPSAAPATPLLPLGERNPSFQGPHGGLLLDRRSMGSNESFASTVASTASASPSADRLKTMTTSLSNTVTFGGTCSNTATTSCSPTTVDEEEEEEYVDVEFSPQPDTLVVEPQHRVNAERREASEVNAPEPSPTPKLDSAPTTTNTSGPSKVVNRKRRMASEESSRDSADENRPPKKRYNKQKTSTQKRRLISDAETCSPVSGMFIKEACTVDELSRAAELDDTASYVHITDESRRRISEIRNVIGESICSLCKVKYADVFRLAMHRCPRIVHEEYRCPECEKVFSCPANLASHRRWHRPRNSPPVDKTDANAASHSRPASLTPSSPTAHSAATDGFATTSASSLLMSH